VEPEIGQFATRRLEQEHAKGNHHNPETEEDYMHVQTNCPSCINEHTYGLMDDHEEGLHDGNEHPECASCRPYGQGHDADVSQLPVPEKRKVGMYEKSIHLINHAALSHDGTQDGCPLCEKHGRNWLFSDRDLYDKEL